MKKSQATLEEDNSILPNNFQKSDFNPPSPALIIPLNSTSYILNSLFSGISQSLILLILHHLFRHSSITSYEIVYASYAFCSLFMFSHLIYKNQYVLDLEADKRTLVLLRGFLSFVGIVLYFEGIRILESVTVAAVVQIGVMIVTRFFLGKEARQRVENIGAMGLSAIAIVLMIIVKIEPVKTLGEAENIVKATSINPDNLKGLTYSALSGLLLGLINHLNL